MGMPNAGHPCAILFTANSGIDPVDVTGCCLPDGHPGPHEFTDSKGEVWLWETDFGCQCEHCMQLEGDYCTEYWRKPPPLPDVPKAAHG